MYFVQDELACDSFYCQHAIISFVFEISYGASYTRSSVM